MRLSVKSILSKLALGSALVFGTVAASAHTITIGYENAGAGSVNFWYGTYHTAAEATTFEGSFELVGINGNPFILQTVPFNLSTTTKPAGLIDGTTNFVHGGWSYSSAITWQGVNFSSLTPGDYQFTYIPIANPSAKWAPITESVRTGTLTLDGQVLQCGVSGLPACPTGGRVPEPAPIAFWVLGWLVWPPRDAAN